MPGRPSLAIAHDYLTQRGGAERVVLALHRMFPDAPIYTTLYDPEGTFPEFREATIVTSWLNRVGPLRRDHRKALPLLPFAASTLRVPADVVIASSTGWAHGFPTSGKRLTYCHSPARFIYLRDEYLGGAWWKSPIGILLQVLHPFLRWWDQRAARRAGPYLANSTVVRERIRRVYGKDAPIVFPPHSVDTDGEQQPIQGLEAFVADGGHHLVVSRLLPYKNVDAAIEAFRQLPDERLLVIGAGPLEDELKAMAPANVRFAKRIPEAQMRWAYARSRALIAPSYEDLGLTPLEAAAWGKPVLALRAGGYLDTVVEGETGAFFDEATPAQISAAVTASAMTQWNVDAMRRVAQSFSEEQFARELESRLPAAADA